MRRLETLEFWAELIELKDALSLRELSERFGVTPGAISAALKRTGITRAPAPPGPRSARHRGATNENNLPPEAGLTAHGAVRPGSKDPLIYAFYDKLGKVPDSVIAKSAGVSVRTVASYRARHDIGGFSGPREQSGKKRQKRSKIDPFVALLGTVPDRVVAEKAGVSLNAVRNYRVKRGISASARPGRPRKNATTANTTLSELKEGKTVWRIDATVRSSDVSGFVIADDAYEALKNAALALGDASVTGIERVGSLLG